jgi:dGTPase
MTPPPPPSAAGPTPAPYAVHCPDDLARVHRDPSDPLRQPLQTDRVRIGRCAAFRRLDFKTQVFVPHQHDHYRTRLTHTLEVAQVGRDLGRLLGLNEDLIEATALAHDLGHPPFGHAGEAVLDRLMADHGGFEHNRQSLRIVDYLEHPFPQFRGLNLTRAVRECMARHETRYDTPVCEQFPPGRLGPLEGQVVDLADEIAYTAADLEDAIHASWVQREQLTELELWNRAWQLADESCPTARDIHKEIQACRYVLEVLLQEARDETRRRLDELRPRSVDDVRDAPVRCVALPPDATSAAGQLQQFLFDNVYRHPAIQSAERRFGQMLRELFDAYVHTPDRLPGRYRRRVEQMGVHQVACDYIAGMTDRFCIAEHDRLMG